MSILYWARGLDVTILVSKKGGRYRLQSGSFEALALLSDDLCARLERMFAGTKGTDEKGAPLEPFAVSFKELLPLQDYFNVMDKHFERRKHVMELKGQLGQAAQQLRVIQKRLLIRFKDKNPSPLNQLDVLLSESYNRLIQLAKDMERAQAAATEAGHMLSCATKLIILLIRAKYELDAANTRVLTAYLNPQVSESRKQGWEECVYASLTHLLRTTLAKNAREQAGVTTSIEPLEDTSKLKRNLQVVCDRLSKGQRLVVPARREAEARKRSAVPPPAQTPQRR